MLYYRCLLLIGCLLYLVDAVPRRRQVAIWTDVQNIIVSKGRLIPDFNGSVYSYSLHLWPSVESILMSIQLNTTKYGMETEFTSPSIYIQGQSVHDYTPLEPIQHEVVLNNTAEAIDMEISVLLIDPLNDGWLRKARSEYVIRIKKPPNLSRLLAINGLSLYDESGNLIPVLAEEACPASAPPMPQYIAVVEHRASAVYVYPQCSTHASGFIIDGVEAGVGSGYKIDMDEYRATERIFFVSCFHRSYQYTNGSRVEHSPIMLVIYRNLSSIDKRDISVALQDSEGGRCSTSLPPGAHSQGDIYCIATTDVIHFTFTYPSRGSTQAGQLVGMMDPLEVIPEVPTDAITLRYPTTAFKLVIPFASPLHPEHTTLIIVVYRNGSFTGPPVTSSSALLLSTTTFTSDQRGTTQSPATTTSTTVEPSAASTHPINTTTTTPHASGPALTSAAGPSTTTTITSFPGEAPTATTRPPPQSSAGWWDTGETTLWPNYPTSDGPTLRISCMDAAGCRCALLDGYIYFCVVLDEVETVQLVATLQTSEEGEDGRGVGQVTLLDDAGKVVVTRLRPGEVSDEVSIPRVPYHRMILRLESSPHDHHHGIFDAFISTKLSSSSSSSSRLVEDYPLMLVRAKDWSHGLHAYERIVSPPSKTIPPTQSPA